MTGPQQGIILVLCVIGYAAVVIGVTLAFPPVKRWIQRVLVALETEEARRAMDDALDDARRRMREATRRDNEPTWKSW